jgi:hypothetical protein
MPPKSDIPEFSGKTYVMMNDGTCFYQDERKSEHTLLTLAGLGACSSRSISVASETLPLDRASSNRQSSLAEPKGVRRQD